MLRRAFDHPPAADREQGVAGEQQLGGGKEIIDLAERVARRLDDLGLKIADLDVVALADRDVDIGNFRGLVARRHDAAADAGA